MANSGIKRCKKSWLTYDDSSRSSLFSDWHECCVALYNQGNIKDKKMPSIILKRVSTIKLNSFIHAFDNLFAKYVFGMYQNETQKANIRPESADATKMAFFFVSEEFMATPILYYFDFAQRMWYWTPDLRNFMPVSTFVVSGGFWQGQTPVIGNQKKIDELRSTQLKIYPFISRLDASQQEQQICVVFWDHVLQFELQNCFLIVPHSQHSSSVTHNAYIELFAKEDQSSLLFKIFNNIEDDKTK
jgi:hypothetical protein